MHGKLADTTNLLSLYGSTFAPLRPEGQSLRKGKMMKEIVFGMICFLLGVSTTLFFLTADRTSWPLREEYPAPALRGTTLADAPNGYRPLVIDLDMDLCVRCCVPVRGEEQEPCVKACIYDGPQDMFLFLCPGDVLKENRSD